VHFLPKQAGHESRNPSQPRKSINPPQQPRCRHLRKGKSLLLSTNALSYLDKNSLSPSFYPGQQMGKVQAFSPSSASCFFRILIRFRCLLARKRYQSYFLHRRSRSSGGSHFPPNRFFPLGFFQFPRVGGVPTFFLAFLGFILYLWSKNPPSHVWTSAISVEHLRRVLGPGPGLTF